MKPPTGAAALSVNDFRHWSCNTIEITGSLDLEAHKGTTEFRHVPFRLSIDNRTAVADLDRAISILVDARDYLVDRIESLQARPELPPLHQKANKPQPEASDDAPKKLRLKRRAL